MTTAERVYELLNGYLTNDVPDEVEGISIRNEFSDGKKCSNLSEKVYDLKQKINERLSTNDDAELERLITYMEEIQKIIALKMYVYGSKIGCNN